MSKPLTPMMQQYWDIKKDYMDCLLFYRMGDFYELFMEDAEIGSKILDIALTSRNKGSEDRIPMCGIPYHSVDQYLYKIIKAGHKAAICEQVTKPSPGKELVQRKVIRIVTPGTIVDETILDQTANNYLMNIVIHNNIAAISYCDISTGSTYAYTITFDLDSSISISNEIKKINPSEIIVDDKIYNNPNLLELLTTDKSYNVSHFSFKNISQSQIIEHLHDFFKIKTLSIYEIEETKETELITAISNLIEYLEYTQKNLIHNVKKIKKIRLDTYMRMDSESITNLELFQSNRMFNTSKSTGFISILDNTSTSMGARMLRNWVLHPLMDIKLINNRQKCTSKLIQEHGLRTSIIEKLNKVSDIERAYAKISSGIGNARDLVNLSISLKLATEVLDLVGLKNSFDEILINREKISTNDILQICNKIDKTITENPPFSVREGSLIRDGINKQLDDIKDSIADSKKWIENLESLERHNTGINNLKVGFNSVFGYYIEITKSNIHLVPDNYIRKQTLVNAERYITQEMKEKEQIVLSAQDKINELEYEIFMQLVKEMNTYAENILYIAEAIGIIDNICGFAEIAIKHNYSRPKILPSDKNKLVIIEGRHPQVERVLPAGEFTPNNTYMDELKNMQIITGPNMAGKSTYIRQVALIQLLAQIGSYIPAQEAEISIVDAIYTRIGAGDALAQGYSTFMVEMLETAKILNNATESSLIILDEVGRGTSTIDGLSIAQSVVEYIHNKIKAKTLFATHFHELISMEQRLKRIKNYHVEIQDNNGEIKFLHRIKEGGTDKSYGIEVAKIAGLPDEVIANAKKLLEKNSTKQLKLDI